MNSVKSEMPSEIENATPPPIDNKEKIYVKGKLIEIARLKNEWFEDIVNPTSFIQKLKNKHPHPDIFSFWQRIPFTEPIYKNYKMEYDDIAVLPISTFDNWWNKQISAKTRNIVRKAEKNNIKIKIVRFSDELVSGISEIFNETPVRQGRQFLHYKKPIDIVKEEMSRELDISMFLSAEFENKMIGFIKLLFCDRYTMMVEILSMLKHRDKSPQNALIAKAVELCAEKKSPFLVYSKWIESSLGDFKRNNGFVKMRLPRYYIPMSFLGKIFLIFGFQRGIHQMLPQPLISFIKMVRKKALLKNISYS